MSRAAEFSAARFPHFRELDALERECKRKARGKRVNYLHTEILWRVRQGETVTVESMIGLYPFVTATNPLAMQHCVNDLRDWGFLSPSTPTLALMDHD